MDYLNEKYVDKDLIHSYKNSDIVITIFFACLDFISIIAFSFNFKPDNKNINKLKKILIKLFLIDIIIRILYTRKYSKWNIFKEIFLNIMTSIQFYLIISFLYFSLYSSKKKYSKGTIFQLCVIFFLFTFSYEILFNIFSLPLFLSFLIKKLILLIQSFCILCILYYLFKLYKDLQKSMKNNRIIKIDEEKKNNVIYLIIIGSPQSIFILFSFYYILKIITTFINNPVLLIYANIILNIFKETSKYFIFFVCQAIIWYLNQIKFRNEEEEHEKLN